jgi:RimK family alpha-L-glutamate ligase
MRGIVAVVGAPGSQTNRELVTAWRSIGLDARLLPAGETHLGPGDVALGRLDVLPTLDGVEPGLLELLRLERRGATVLNRAFALLAAHDKLLTARVLARAGVTHPRTAHATTASAAIEIEPPVVVKPRFGSWGIDVFRCDSPAALNACLRSVAGRPWFRRHGALVQELLPSPGHDLRLVVAGGTVIGAIERHPRRDEWRTNTSLGASKRSARPGDRAVSLALAAAAALGIDLVGVDLLPLGEGSYSVIELNGAADFDRTYDPDGDVYVRAARALGLTASGLATQ